MSPAILATSVGWPVGIAGKAILTGSPNALSALLLVRRTIRPQDLDGLPQTLHALARELDATGGTFEESHAIEAAWHRLRNGTGRSVLGRPPIRRLKHQILIPLALHLRRFNEAHYREGTRRTIKNAQLDTAPKNDTEIVILHQLRHPPPFWLSPVLMDLMLARLKQDFTREALLHAMWADWLDLGGRETRAAAAYVQEGVSWLRATNGFRENPNFLVGLPFHLTLLDSTQPFAALRLFLTLAQEAFERGGDDSRRSKLAALLEYFTPSERSWDLLADRVPDILHDAQTLVNG